MTKSAPEPFRIIPFFAALDQATFTALSQRCVVREAAAREIIIGHQDETYDVLFLLEGTARVSIYASDGTCISFKDIAPGAIFGEISAIDGEPRSAGVECLSACKIAILRRADFLAALAEHPQFAMAVMRHLTATVRRLTTRVVEFSTLAVRQRLRAELLRLAEEAGNGGQDAVLSPAPMHAELASRISTHREAVSRAFSWLEKHGVITKEGRSLRITSLQRLRDLVASDEEAS